MLSTNLVASLRQRMAVVLAVVAVATLCCFGGAFTSFFAAPKQRVDASRLAGLPTLSATELDAAEAGQRVIVMGTLTENLSVSAEGDFVAYQLETWETTLVEDDESGDFRTGRWNNEDRVEVIPTLTVAIDGGTIVTNANESAQMTGTLHEEIFESDSPESDRSNNRPDGSRRYHGLRNGDLVTILGAKAESGGIIPEELFAGDRVAFDQANRQQATGLFQAGLCLMALAPMLLIGGLLFAFFKR